MRCRIDIQCTFEQFPHNIIDNSGVVFSPLLEFFKMLVVTRARDSFIELLGLLMHARLPLLDAELDLYKSVRVSRVNINSNVHDVHC